MSGVPLKKVVEKKSQPSRSRKLEELSSSSKGKRYGYIMLAIIGVAIAVTFFGGQLLASVFQKPEVENPEYNIGYFRMTVMIRTDEGSYEKVDANVTFVDYYDETIISENNLANGNNIFQVTNVTFGVITNLTYGGMIYPNETFLIYANSTAAHAYNNVVFVNGYGTASQFEVNLYKLNDVYGDYDMTDITGLSGLNFSLGVSMNNSGNGTFGQRFYITEPFRYNQSVVGHGLWLQCNSKINYVTIDSIPVEDVYFDGTNTYILIDTVYPRSVTDIIMDFRCEALPSQFKFIDGQWNGLLVETLS